MASLCVGYLSLPGFYGFLSDESVKELLNNGYYAFLDYAVRYWTSHLKSGLTTSADETVTISVISLLQDFLSMHYQTSGASIEVPYEARQAFRFLQLYQWGNFEQFLQAFHAKDEQVRTFGESAALNQALDIPDVISRIRRSLEETKLESNSPNGSMISSFYGVDVFKCSRLSCDFFHRGFHTAKQRDEHIEKHNRSFGCPFPVCVRATLGFSTQRELQKHISQTHKSMEQESNIFPSKKASPALQCSRCEEFFYKPRLLLNHDCTMGRNPLQERNSDGPAQKLKATIDAVDETAANVTQSSDKITAVMQAQRVIDPGVIHLAPSPEFAPASPTFMFNAPSPEFDPWSAPSPSLSVGNWFDGATPEYIPAATPFRFNAPSPEFAPATPPQLGSSISLSPSQLMTPQQEWQTASDMGKQGTISLSRPLPSRVIVETNWTANLPPEINSIYRDIAQYSRIAFPLPMTLSQRYEMSELLMGFIHDLARLDVLLVEVLGKRQDQQKIIRNLLTLRFEMMRQFKDTDSWDLKDYFTISHDYLVGGIAFIRQLFRTMAAARGMSAANNGSEIEQNSLIEAPSTSVKFAHPSHNPADLVDLIKDNSGFEQG
ncbi:hypothetical protein N7528_004015 [Penicillium herquei]|nr:hypothetical protein N7528_004015 [Penicillium herquei]